MTLESSFAYFGARVTNSRWSRSARRHDQPTVIVALWQDLFQIEAGRLTYDIGEDEARCTSPGARERWLNLRWAQDNCNGLVRVVVVVAQDEKKRRRAVAKSFPQKVLTMKIVTLDRDSGKCRLEAVANLGP